MENPFMIEANEACKLEIGEVPVSAIIVGITNISAHNLRETENQATYHAEILCIERHADCSAHGGNDCDLYVTLNHAPCVPEPSLTHG